MNIKSRSIVVPAFVALAVVLGSVSGSAPRAFAYDEASTSAINVEGSNVILHGFDPIAYFTVGKPVKGKNAYSAEFEGATYHFASAENMKAFQADPAKYAPAFGGFCAMGVALGKKLDVDPSVFEVVDGKLYLNVNADVKKKWVQDIPGNIKTANETWPTIENKAPKDL
ncbi:YHS domain-containing (seleno)protein [Dongia sp.]|jgi:YHS domain-containing protein|uniref:YHS domain-containing (seleno)protein n=1 Tax=Dongia sp. TaxID=1977262 RepID=UPI0034A14D23